MTRKEELLFYPHAHQQTEIILTKEKKTFGCKTHATIVQWVFPTSHPDPLSYLISQSFLSLEAFTHISLTISSRYHSLPR